MKKFFNIIFGRAAERGVAVMLGAALCMSLFTSCSRLTTLPLVDEPTPTPAPTERVTEEKEEVSERDYIAIGYSDPGGNFSPFYARSEGARDAVAITSVRLLTTDGDGNALYDAASTGAGIADLSVEYSAFSGTTAYTWTLAEDLRFSDGERLTADDVIFSYYVLCDYSYSGPVRVNALPIVGLKDYQRQTTESAYSGYASQFDAIYAAGRGAEGFDAGRQISVWAAVDQAWINDAQAIVDYCFDNYLNARAAEMGYTPEEIGASDGLRIVFGMWNWNCGSFKADGSFKGAYTEKIWDLRSEFPTAADFAAEFRKNYDDNPEKYWGIESVRDTNIVDSARDIFARKLGAGGIPNISGIKKTGEFSVTVTLAGNVTDAGDSLGIYVAPLHYYGDEGAYDYDNNKFGFKLGDLSGIQEKSRPNTAAGPYVLTEFSDGVAVFKANADYYKGAPKTEEIRFLTVSESQRATALAEGRIDIGRLPVLGLSALRTIEAANEAQEHDFLEILTVPGENYGYIGINSAAVKVGSDPASDESRALRRAFATLFSAYRDIAVQSVYHGAASVSDAPIAMPHGSLSYGKSADGADIYVSGMTEDARLAQAAAAAVGFFRAAGYVWNETTGKFTSAPEGALMEYVFLLPEEGDLYEVVGETARLAGEVLSGMGISLAVTDGAAASHMRGGVWNAAEGKDMYETYHSSAGGFGNMSSARLDELVSQLRGGADAEAAKSACEESAGIIADWAVMIPLVRDSGALVINVGNVDIDTFSTRASWTDIAHELEPAASPAGAKKAAD